jgi:hypothetical protein
VCANNRIYVLGSYLSEYFDIATQTWNTFAPKCGKTGVRSAMCVAANGNFYECGGQGPYINSCCQVPILIERKLNHFTFVNPPVP